MKRLELRGQKPYRLLAVSPQRDKKNKLVWFCVCDCGEPKILDANRFLSGKVKSCGCYNNELRLMRSTKHGMSKHPVFKIWAKIRQRCYNSKCKEYKYYGGSGITMSEEWMADFRNFYNDMGERPSKEYSVERINNLKGYTKENCKWATDIEQANNKRNNRFIEYQGTTKTLQQWANLLGIQGDTLAVRIKAWGVEKAFTNPLECNEGKRYYKELNKLNDILTN